MWKGLYKQSVESYILLVGINFTANILYTHIFLNIDRRSGMYVGQISLVYSKSRNIINSDLNKKEGNIKKYNNNSDLLKQQAQALTVTWVSETLHWLPVRRAYICISAAPI